MSFAKKFNLRFTLHTAIMLIIYFVKKYVSILGKVQGLKSFPYNFIMGLKSMCINVDFVIAEFVNLQVCTICISMKLDVQMVTFPDFDNK